MKKAAEQGYPCAQMELASCYHDGKVVSKDYKKALVWWTRAAEQGYPSAQMLLGNCYELAAKKMAYAQFIMSRDYYFGLGVRKNLEKWKEWLDKAAENGLKEAQDLLDALKSLNKTTLYN